MTELPWQEHAQGFVLRSRYFEAYLERLASTAPDDERYQARIVTPAGQQWESEVGLSYDAADWWVWEQIRFGELLEWGQLHREMTEILSALLQSRHPIYQQWLLAPIADGFAGEVGLAPEEIKLLAWRQDGLRSEADTPLGLVVITEERGKRNAYSFGHPITYRPALLDPTGAKLAGPACTEWEHAELWLHEMFDGLFDPVVNRHTFFYMDFVLDICERLLSASVDPMVAQYIDMARGGVE